MNITPLTDLVFKVELSWWRPASDETLKVDVLSLLNFIHLNIPAKTQTHSRLIWKMTEVYWQDIAAVNTTRIASNKAVMLIYNMMEWNMIFAKIFDYIYDVDTDSVWWEWCCPGPSGLVGGGWKPHRRGWSCDPWDLPGTLSQSCYQSETSTISSIITINTWRG